MFENGRLPSLADAMCGLRLGRAFAAVALRDGPAARAQQGDWILGHSTFQPKDPQRPASGVFLCSRDLVFAQDPSEQQASKESHLLGIGRLS